VKKDKKQTPVSGMVKQSLKGVFTLVYMNYSELSCVPYPLPGSLRLCILRKSA